MFKSIKLNLFKNQSITVKLRDQITSKSLSKNVQGSGKKLLGTQSCDNNFPPT
jgi:hypothetical protein